MVVSHIAAVGIAARKIWY